MKRKVIYQKTYPDIDLDELEALAGAEYLFGDNDDSAPSFDEFMKRVYQDTVYWLLPERVKTAKEFINRAIELSEMYEIDAEIIEHDTNITVDYFFDGCACMGFLKELIQYADDIAFFINSRGREIQLSMEYYTHAIIRNGRRVSP